uniref:PKD domain-containing protein n=1 Tax=Roseihalotalea indica TaxID=2867963 RepID=A0AA49JK17_9BACT|nr:hypothetical protein K4G66_15490 [Tunicatimonas sp. TK19036]
MNRKVTAFLLFIAGAIVACEQSEEDTVVPAPEACIQISDTVVHVGDSVTLSSCSSNASTIFWDTPSGDTVFLEQFTHAFSTPGDKRINLVAENEAGERSYNYVTITVTGQEGKVYSAPELANNYYPQDIVTTPDQGYLITYRLWPSVSNDQQQLRIESFNAEAEYQSSYVLQVGGANVLYSDILKLSNGKIGITWSDYISGRSGGRMAFGGTDLSQFEIMEVEPRTSELGFKGLLEKDETVYAFGFQGGVYDFDLIIRKTNLAGAFIEDKTIAKPEVSLMPHTMLATDDDGFIIAGLMSTNVGSQSSPEDKVFLFKTDADFNIVWEKYFGTTEQYESIHQVVETADGALLCYGYNDQLYFQRISADGEEVVEKTIEVDLSNQAGDMIDYGNGYLIATGSTLLKTDYELNTLSQKFLNHRSKAVKIISRAEGGFTLLSDIAISNSEVGTSPSGVYIVKLDEEGDIEYFME